MKSLQEHTLPPSILAMLPPSNTFWSIPTHFGSITTTSPVQFFYISKLPSNVLLCYDGFNDLTRILNVALMDPFINPTKSKLTTKTTFMFPLLSLILKLFCSMVLYYLVLSTQIISSRTSLLAKLLLTRYHLSLLHTCDSSCTLLRATWRHVAPPIMGMMSHTDNTCPCPYYKVKW